MSELEKTSDIKPERDENGRLLPGNTANPNGRPKGSFSLVEMIKNKLQEIPEGKDKTYAEYFVEQIMKKSVIEGDTSMMKDMINRVDGMPRQNIGLDGGADNKPISILNGAILSNNSNKEDNSAQEED